jgi:hypothetical protein
MSRSYTVQYTAKSFQLSRANREILQQAECNIQVNSFFFILLEPLGLFRIIIEQSTHSPFYLLLYYLCVLISYLGFHLQPLCSTCIDFLSWVSFAATMFNLYISVIYLEFVIVFFPYAGLVYPSQ